MDIKRAALPPGAIIPFAGGSSAASSWSPPGGWLLCDGSAISRTTYAALFAAIGTSHGIGNGTTTFNLPDLRGRFIRGYDPNATGNDPDQATRTAAVAGTFTLSPCSTVSGSPDVTVPSTIGLAQGMSVSGTGIPANVYILYIKDATTIRLGASTGQTSSNATATNSGLTLTFSKSATVGYLGSYQADQVGPHNHSIGQPATSTAGANSGLFNGNNGVGGGTTGTLGTNQSHPRNIYLNYLIKY